eukprot:2363985-Rhodomonas_salina.2
MQASAVHFVLCYDQLACDMPPIGRRTRASIGGRSRLSAGVRALRPVVLTERERVRWTMRIASTLARARQQGSYRRVGARAVRKPSSLTWG